MPALDRQLPVLQSIEKSSGAFAILGIDLDLLLQQKLHIILIVSMLVLFLHVAVQQGSAIRISVLDIQVVLLKKMKPNLISPFTH